MAVESAPSPGIIALSDDDTGAVGMRVGGVHVMPSVDVESTRSFAEHEGRKRQSPHVA